MSNKVSNFPNAAKPKATPQEVGQLVGIMDELRQLPPVSKGEPDLVEERLNLYFKFCTDHGIKCSVEGMQLALGRSRQCLWEWEQDAQSKAGQLVARAKELINAMLVEWSADGKMPFPFAIWLQKQHYNYSDNHVLEVKPYTEPHTISIEEQIEQAGLRWDEALQEYIPAE